MTTYSKVLDQHSVVRSHQGFFHLLFNCMALASFGKSHSPLHIVPGHSIYSATGAAASQQLYLQFKKVEQERGALSEASPRWHLLALFVSGAFSKHL